MRKQFPLPNGRMPGTNLEEEDPEGVKPALEEIRVSTVDQTNVARLRNCILALAKSWLPIYDTTVMNAYEVSSKYEVGELLRAEVMAEIGDAVKLRLSSEIQEILE